MVFKVKLIRSAQIDLADAIDYYYRIHPNLSLRFHDELMDLYGILEKNPFFSEKYRTVRTCNLKSFPYLIHFVIDEDVKQVLILAIVFGRMEKTTFEERISES